jgi:hypothetical protein
MKINEKYILTFEIQGKVLTYTGKILEETDSVIVFLDKFNKTLTYNKNYLISAQEVDSNGQ